MSSATPGKSVLHVVLAVDPRAKLQAANLPTEENCPKGTGSRGHLNPPGKVVKVGFAGGLAVYGDDVDDVPGVVEDADLESVGEAEAGVLTWR